MTQKPKKMSNMHPTKKEKKNGDELRCSRRVTISCFLYDTRCVTHIYSSVRWKSWQWYMK